MEERIEERMEERIEERMEETTASTQKSSRGRMYRESIGAYVQYLQHPLHLITDFLPSIICAQYHATRRPTHCTSLISLFSFAGYYPFFTPLHPSTHSKP